MIRIISDCSAYGRTLLSLSVLFLSACGGGSTPPPATVTGAMATISEVPPCGIDGSGVVHIQDCNRGGENQTPPSITGSPPIPGLRMTIARASHTATLLHDGKVLIAGGFGEAERLASAELYDPSTGVFTPTGNMTRARARHTATLLTDGRILIAGGVIDTQTGTYDVSAEIYDPVTGTFSATGNMISSGWHPATLLPGNKVLIAEDGNAEIYDPASGTFSLTAAYADPNQGGDTAALLLDGLVLVTGGCATPQCNTTGAELYDPHSGRFSITGSSPGARLTGGPTPASLLMDGKVLMVASNDSGFPDDAQIYEPASGSFTDIGHTRAIHEFSTATRLPDGTVLIAGGQLPGGNGNVAVELYVPATSAFAPAANLTFGRHTHTATLLADGTVLIAGGYNVWPQPTSSAEIYK